MKASNGGNGMSDEQVNSLSPLSCSRTFTARSQLILCAGLLTDTFQDTSSLETVSQRWITLTQRVISDHHGLEIVYASRLTNGGM